MTKDDAITLAETALGENLVWLSDQLDVQIRQRDAETLRRLKQLNDAWVALAKVLPLIQRVDAQDHASSHQVGIVKVYIQENSDTGLAKAYVEWDNGARTEGEAKIIDGKYVVGTRMQQLLSRAGREGLMLGFERR